MKRRVSALALALIMVLTMALQPAAVQAAETGVCDFEVTLPEGYDKDHAYPVVYVMPQDGYKADNSGITEKLQAAMEDGVSTDMIIVRPVFTENTDLHAAMEALVAEIDATYSTIPSAGYRAIVGTGVGGYLAYILGLTEEVVVEEETTETAGEAEETTTEAGEEETTAAEEAEETTTEAGEEETTAAEEVEETTTEAGEEETTAAEEAEEEETTTAEVVAAEEEAVSEYASLKTPKLFKYIASTRGDFVSGANAWYDVYGDVYSYLESMKVTITGADGRKQEINYVDNFYTYIDAPVTDKWTNMEGSSNDIGALFINFGTAAAAHEFTVRTGSFTDVFLTEAVNRIADRVTSGMVSGLAAGSVSLTKAALTSDVETAEVNYTVNVNNLFGSFSSVEEAMTVELSVIDPATEEVLDSVTLEEDVTAGETVTGTVEVANLVNGSSSTVQLSVNLLGTEMILAATTLTRIQDTVVEDDYQYIDLMGDWYFKYMGQGNKTGIDVSILTAEEYKTWSVVQPALTQWTKGFGNISDANVSSPWGPDYFDYMIYGDGYYVRTFEVPESFDAEELVLSVGYIDDRGEVFINGQLVGATGMENGVGTGESAWAIYSYYELDPAVLNIGGTNTIVVRCQNDGVGGGGWYGGPVAIYSKAAFESDESTSSLFFEDSFDSEYAASAQGKEGTVENKYLVYLPEGYHESDKYYPTVYLMHQYNSDHTSYIIDDVDTLINEAIKQALIDEMIVVVPNSSENSWWAGDWQKMVTEELVPLIDSTYRTIDDARYRFTAGCSMGGQGAYAVALTNPDYFSGAISFFGAFSYGGDLNPVKIAAQESAEYLNNYALYFICGNQDVYGFGEPAIQLNQILEEKGVEHEFFIENGGHDSTFYLPHFIEAFVYIRENMYHSDEAVEELLSGTVSVNNGIVKAEFEALEGIEDYYNMIPDSSYTEDTTPKLSIPLTIEVVQNGEVVYSAVERDHAINAGDVTETFKYDISVYVDLDAEYTITYKAAIFDRVVELAAVTINGPEEIPGETETPDESKPEKTPSETPDESKPEGTKPSTGNAPDTGDTNFSFAYVPVMIMALAAVVMVIRRKRFER